MLDVTPAGLAVRELVDGLSLEEPERCTTLGIKGNSHMLMQDRNSDQLADLVLAWLDRHVDGKGGQPKNARR